MRPLVIIALTCCLALPAHAATAPHAAPPVAPEGRLAPDGEQDTAPELEAAEKAWSAGDWAEVRSLLDPLVMEGHLDQPGAREKALPMLADATLQDESMDGAVRRRLAGTHVDRLIDANPDWRIPEGIYSQELAELVRERLDARQRADSAQCAAERNACRADLAQTQAEQRDLTAEHTRLQQDYADQLVEVREQVKRSRGWALVPFGVGHFYNGNVTRRGTSKKERRNVALGAGFLVAEAAFGATGLGLLIWRNTVAGCTRDGFGRGSLTCTYDDGEAVARRRQAEEVMGWLFIGTMVFDVVLAQILFEPISTTRVERIKRSELDAEAEPGPRRKPRRKQARAKVRPTPAVVPGGGGLGVNVRF